MKFEQKLTQGILLKRYKRFFADVELVIDGKKRVEVAHVPNTGSLKGCLEPGQKCLVQQASNPERKLRWTLQAIQSGFDKNWIGVNTANPGKLLFEGFQNQKVQSW
jgi:sugar fermentation stimulation protein A